VDVNIAECPFSGIKKGKAIRCEGLSKGNSIYLTFRFETACVRHIEAHCGNQDGWANCPIARMLSEKYENGK
jgi:hypothetical protein